MTLNAGTRPTEATSIGDRWAVPVIGVRGNWKISEKWSATGFFDVGSAFSGSSETWQILGTMNYSFNDSWQARFGYRHLDVSKKINGADVDVGLSGPVVGLTYRF